MVPRSRVDVVHADEQAPVVLDRMATGHTRYPVIGATPDDLVGVVHLHDLLAPGVRTQTAAAACRPAVIVPTTLPLPETLRKLTEAGDEMALVIDEYGSFAGVLTIEDLAEELVGEIADEHDSESTEIVPVDDGWLIRGDVASTNWAAPSDTICPKAITRPSRVWSSPSSAVFRTSAMPLTSILQPIRPTSSPTTHRSHGSCTQRFGPSKSGSRH